MKTRERLNRIKTAKDWLRKFQLATDEHPGTPWDSEFVDMADAWCNENLNDPNAAKKVCWPVIKQWLQRQEQERKKATIAKLRKADNGNGGHDEKDFHSMAVRFPYENIGRSITNGCLCFGSVWLREMADALDSFMTHEPQEDRLRSALLWIVGMEHYSPVISMKRIMELLPKHGILVDENTERRVRKLSPELGITITGKAGRPKA